MSWVEAELREQPVALQRFLDAEALNAQEITHRLQHQVIIGHRVVFESLKELDELNWTLREQVMGR